MSYGCFFPPTPQPMRNAPTEPCGRQPFLQTLAPIILPSSIPESARGRASRLKRLRVFALGNAAKVGEGSKADHEMTRRLKHGFSETVAALSSRAGASINSFRPLRRQNAAQWREAFFAFGPSKLLSRGLPSPGASSEKKETWGLRTQPDSARGAS